MAACGSHVLLLGLLLLALTPTPASSHVDDYIGYVHRHLPNATGYKRDLLLAIRDLYTDLKAQRQPVTHAKYDNVVLHPIGFSIPEELVARSPPSKTTPLHLPHWATPQTESMRFRTSDQKDGERAYYRTMSRAYFSLTASKSGWDCLRHLEVMAAGSLPLFSDIDLAPKGCLAAYPKRLFAVLLKQPGLRIQGKRVFDHFNATLDVRLMDKELYMVTTSALLTYTRRVLTTTAMAEHLLSVMGLAQPKKVLYLTFRDPNLIKGKHYISHLYGDFMADTLLHGLKSLLGQANVVDFDKRHPQYKTVQDFDLRHFLQHRSEHYGQGFTYACRLFEPEGVVARDNLPARIRAGEFAAVVFGEAHRGDLTQHPLYDEVCRNVPASRVAAVWGDDAPPTYAQFPMLQAIMSRGCIQHLFSREIYEGYRRGAPNIGGVRAVNFEQ